LKKFLKTRQIESQFYERLPSLPWFPPGIFRNKIYFRNPGKKRRPSIIFLFRISPEYRVKSQTLDVQRKKILLASPAALPPTIWLCCRLLVKEGAHGKVG